MITRKEAFGIMRSTDKRGRATRFTIKVAKLDRKRKTGGEMVTYENVTLSGVGAGGVGEQETVFEQETLFDQEKATKKPNHFKHKTINVVLPDNQIRKVHVPLILRINDTFIY